MGLFNPILGDIPQPQENSKEVAFKDLPKSNYSANVVVPLTNTLFCHTLELDSDDTDTFTLIKPIVFTQVLIQGYFLSAADSLGSLDIYINNIKLLSVNHHCQAALNPYQDLKYDIPLEHVLFNTGSQIRAVSVVSSGSLITNISFIGYEYTKQ